MAGSIRTHARTRTRARAYWQAQLPVACNLCGHPIAVGDLFDLDHTLPLALGGSDLAVRPAHRYCNRAQGTAISRAAHGPRPGRGRLVAVESKDRDW
jgi:5-methylcytosine-specific restriction endonuclease McrA